MTNIEWTQAPGFKGETWNPVIGCQHVAEGCRNCYAETMSKRLAAMGQADYAQVLNEQGRFNGKATPRPEKLAEPLHWRKPRMVFVNSMSDLFHEDVTFEFIAAVYGVMAACPQHTFQVLTKRPERMLEFFDWIAAKAAGDDTVANTSREFAVMQAWRHDGPENGLYMRGFNTTSKHALGPWPLPNVWHGVSVAEQKDADKNIPILQKVPSAVRFISAEPLIGDVDFYAVPQECPSCGKQAMRSLLADDGSCWEQDYCEACESTWWCQPQEENTAPEARPFPELDWVIVGGESGPGARPCDVAWIRSIVSQCKSAGVPVFVKQLGLYPVNDLRADAVGVHPTVDDGPSSARAWERGDYGKRLDLKDRKGGDPSEWPEDLRVREFPGARVGAAT